MKIWGHRGASHYAPENTMEAFKEAIKQGADGIETDVHLTKDGVLVLMHDETVDRTSDGHGYIKDLTYKQLTTLNCNNHQEGFAFCAIPTLEMLLQLVKGTAIELNLEIKTDVIVYPEIEEKVVAMVKTYGLENQVYYSSFNHYSLLKIKSLAPDAKLGLLFQATTIEPWKYAQALNIEALHPYYPSLQCDNYIENIHAYGIQVRPWTVNDPALMKTLKAQGCDAIITNDVKLGVEINEIR